MFHIEAINCLKEQAEWTTTQIYKDIPKSKVIFKAKH